MDMSLRDVNMCECVNGHTFCQEETLEDFVGDIEIYEVDEKYCPVCNFKNGSNIDLAKYLLKETKIPRDEVFAEVKKSNARRKKLYDEEYVMYACLKNNIDRNAMLPALQQRFGNYKAFLDYIRG